MAGISDNPAGSIMSLLAVAILDGVQFLFELGCGAILVASVPLDSDYRRALEFKTLSRLRISTKYIIPLYFLT